MHNENLRLLKFFNKVIVTIFLISSLITIIMLLIEKIKYDK